jgi:hypothetical protein
MRTRRETEPAALQGVDLPELQAIEGGVELLLPRTFALSTRLTRDTLLDNLKNEQNQLTPDQVARLGSVGPRIP